MNRILKVLWSKVLGCFVVAAELANQHSKGGVAAGQYVAVCALLIAFTVFTALPASAESYANHIGDYWYYADNVSMKLYHIHDSTIHTLDEFNEKYIVNGAYLNYTTQNLYKVTVAGVDYYIAEGLMYDGYNVYETVNLGDGDTYERLVSANRLLAFGLDPSQVVMRDDLSGDVVLPGTLTVSGDVRSLNGRIIAKGLDAGREKITNVADATNDTDAVNKHQLDAVALDVSSLSEVAVKYDSSSKAQITLEGRSGTKITNVGAGEISSGSKDAINGGQLYGIANVTNPGTYISTGTNVAANLTALDAQTKANSDAITIESSARETADTALSERIGTVSNGNYISSSASAGTNIVALDTQLKNVSDAANAGWNIQANNSAAVKVAPSDTVKLLNGSNIEITQDSRQITIKTADAPVFSGRVSAKGFDAGNEKIINVADATSANDAVNKGQLDAAVQSVTSGYSDLTTAVNTLDSLAVKYDSTAKDIVTFLGSSGTLLKGVAAGALSETSTEAVNGSQLYSLGTSFASALGGSSVFVPDSASVDPNLTVGGNSYMNVNSALEAVNAAANRAYDLAASAAGGGSGSGSSNAQFLTFADGTNTTVALNAGEVIVNVVPNPTFRGRVTAKGFDAGNAKILNVSNGSISENSLDGVNGSQIYSLASSYNALLGVGELNPYTGSVTGQIVVGDTNYDSFVSALTAIADSQGQGGGSGSGSGGSGSVTPTGSIAQGDNNAVSGNTVYHETRVASDGNYIKAENSASGNLTVLDDALKSVSNTASAGWNLQANDGPAENIAPDATVTFRNGSNVEIVQNGNVLTVKLADAPVFSGRVSANGFDARGEKITGVADGAIAENSAEAVNGGQIYGMNNVDKTGNYISAGTNVAGNLTALDTQVRSNQDSIETLDRTAVKYDGEGKDKITLAGKDGTKITNLARGSVDSDSTDAVNGAQIFSLGDSLAESFGGTSVFNSATGRVEMHVQLDDGSAYTDLRTALNEINKAAHGETDTITARELTVTEKATFHGNVTMKKNLKVDNDVQIGRNLYVAGSGTFGGPLYMQGNRITGLAAGAISSGSTDAVTGGQVYELGQGFQQQMNEMNSRLSKEIKHVGARSAALAGLHPLPFDGRKKTTVSASFGHYRGQSAVALGVGHYFNPDTLLTVGSTIGKEPMVNLGVSFRVGPSFTDEEMSARARARAARETREELATTKTRFKRYREDKEAEIQILKMRVEDLDQRLGVFESYR